MKFRNESPSKRRSFDQDQFPTIGQGKYHDRRSGSEREIYRFGKSTQTKGRKRRRLEIEAKDRRKERSYFHFPGRIYCQSRQISQGRNYTNYIQ